MESFSKILWLIPTKENKNKKISKTSCVSYNNSITYISIEFDTTVTNVIICRNKNIF